MAETRDARTPRRRIVRRSLRVGRPLEVRQPRRQVVPHGIPTTIHLRLQVRRVRMASRRDDPHLRVRPRDHRRTEPLVEPEVLELERLIDDRQVDLATVARTIGRRQHLMQRTVVPADRLVAIRVADIERRRQRRLVQRRHLIVAPLLACRLPVLRRVDDPATRLVQRTPHHDRQQQRRLPGLARHRHNHVPVHEPVRGRVDLERNVHDVPLPRHEWRTEQIGDPRRRSTQRRPVSPPSREPRRTARR